MFTSDEIVKIKSEIEYCRLNENDTNDISDLITSMSKQSKAQYNLRSKSPEYYKWIYFKNPSGNAIVYGAKHNGRLIGNFAMAPKKMQIGGKIVIFGKTMDIVTDPGYQGIGLMSQLSKRVFDDSREGGIQHWYVTPSVNSYPIFLNKWKYIQSFEVLYRMKILNFGDIIKTIDKIKIIIIPLGEVISRLNGLLNKYSKNSSKYEVGTIEKFGDEEEELWEKIRGLYKVSLYRDSAYMNWRYIDNPDKYTNLSFKSDGFLRGVIILKITIRRGLKIGEIVDLLAPKEDFKLRKEMVQYGIAHLKNQKCSAVQSWVIEHSEMENEMIEFGLKLNRNKVNFLLSPGCNDELFYDGSAWFLTQGDGNDV